MKTKTFSLYHKVILITQIYLRFLKINNLNDQWHNFDWSNYAKVDVIYNFLRI